MRLISGLINNTFQTLGQPDHALNAVDIEEHYAEHPVKRTTKVIFYDPKSRQGKIVAKTEEGWVTTLDNRGEE